MLISSWDYDISSPEAEQLGYLPRYTSHGYAPINEPSSSKFIGLDLFHTANIFYALTFRMSFQRDAMAYAFVDVDDGSRSMSIL